jgi:hypothetical protein
MVVGVFKFAGQDWVRAGWTTAPGTDRLDCPLLSSQSNRPLLSSQSNRRVSSPGPGEDIPRNTSISRSTSTFTIHAHPHRHRHTHILPSIQQLHEQYDRGMPEVCLLLFHAASAQERARTTPITDSYPRRQTHPSPPPPKSASNHRPSVRHY